MPLPDDAVVARQVRLQAHPVHGLRPSRHGSPVGANVDIVESGVNGLLASTTAQWVAALDALAASPSDRARMGQAGRAAVLSRFCVDAVLPRMVGSFGRRRRGSGVPQSGQPPAGPVEDIAGGFRYVQAVPARRLPMSELDALTRIDGRDTGELDKAFVTLYPELKPSPERDCAAAGSTGRSDPRPSSTTATSSWPPGARSPSPTACTSSPTPRETLRSIIVDVVRERRAQRRGGGVEMVTLDTGAGERPRRPRSTSRRSQQRARRPRETRSRPWRASWRMRFFGGMTEYGGGRGRSSVSEAHRDAANGRRRAPFCSPSGSATERAWPLLVLHSVHKGIETPRAC